MKAYGDNLVVKTVPMPEEKKIMTPDGDHPWAVEVVSIGDLVDGVEEGDIVCAAGNQQEFIADHYIIHSSQVKAIVSEDEL